MNRRIIKTKELNGLVSVLCRNISSQSWRPEYIVGVNQSGLVPAVMLSNWLNVPMYALSTEESNLWMAEDAYGYNLDAGKRILLVDSLNDDGEAFNHIMLDWAAGCLPNDQRWEDGIWNSNVRFAAVVDRLSSKCRVGMDYIGEEMDSDIPVEFPWQSWWT